MKKTMAMLCMAAMFAGCGPGDQITGNNYDVRFYGENGNLTASYHRNGSDDKTLGFEFSAGADKKLSIKKSEATDQLAGFQAQGYEQWQASQQYMMAGMFQLIGAALGKDIAMPPISTGGTANMYRTATPTAARAAAEATLPTLLLDPDLTDAERLAIISAFAKTAKKKPTTQPAAVP